jgi:competence protein ComFC
MSNGNGEPEKKSDSQTSVTVFRRSLAALGQRVRGGIIDLCYPPTCVFCQGDLLTHSPRFLSSAGDHVAGEKPLGQGNVTGPAVQEGCAQTLCRECCQLLSSSYGIGCQRCGAIIPDMGTLGLTDTAGESPLVGSTLVGNPLVGNPLVGSGARRMCTSCSTEPGVILQVVTLGFYRDCLREAVVAAKRMSFMPLTLALGDLLAYRIRREFEGMSFDGVTYIPSHWSRRLRRGGWPTQSLARRVAWHLGVPAYSMLRVTRRTAKQGMLNDQDRQTNVLGAFEARKGYALRGGRVLLVDDVWTTGSTIQEAAGVLQQNFGVEVYAAVVARAVGVHQRSAR